MPDVLKNQVTQAVYRKWLNVKASALRQRDIWLKRPFASVTPRNVYVQKLHDAAVKTGLYDPYSGDGLRWDLIGEWDPQKAKGNSGYKKEFALLPTADHVDPDADELGFEICSWLSNTAKTFLSPEEFVALCGKIIRHCPPLRARETMTVPAYGLPGYLVGVCAPAVYHKWLNTRAKQEYKRDVKIKRPCAMHGSKALYKQAIHDAACAGDGTDPFTGDKLQWDRIDTWASAAPKNGVNPEKDFSLLPTVDHIDPDADAIGFEICSWLVNDSKGQLSALEYVDYCGRVVAHVSVVPKLGTTEN